MPTRLTFRLSIKQKKNDRLFCLIFTLTTKCFVSIDGQPQNGFHETDNAINFSPNEFSVIFYIYTKSRFMAQLSFPQNSGHISMKISACEKYENHVGAYERCLFSVQVYKCTECIKHAI